MTYLMLDMQDNETDETACITSATLLRLYYDIKMMMMMIHIYDDDFDDDDDDDGSPMPPS